MKAFLLGMFEFRSQVTAHFDDYFMAYRYDQGRELAHRLTFRYFEAA